MPVPTSPRALCAFAALAGLSLASLHAQSEADRPAGEVTSGMLAVKDGSLRSPVIPTPQESYWKRDAVVLGDASALQFDVELRGGAQAAKDLPAELTARLERSFPQAKVAHGGGVTFVFALSPDDAPAGQAWFKRQLGTLTSDEGYLLGTYEADGRAYVVVVGKTTAALWHGMVSAVQLVTETGGKVVIPGVNLVDYPRMDERALLTDIGGQGYMIGPSRWELPEWKHFVDWMVDHKMNSLWLEIIGSGRLMGNLDMDAGEWIGFPVDLKCYPQLVCRDRPLKHWDEAQGKVVTTPYTAPNVRHDFMRELIDYAQARGVKCVLLIGYDYFANQLPVVLGVPGNDPRHKGANEVYDRVLQEVVQRYSNVSGVCLITIENKNVDPAMVDAIAARTKHGQDIIHAINPQIKVDLLADYLEWRPQEELEHMQELLPSDVGMAYSPHRQPQQKSWQRLFPDIWRYDLYTQYAWDHIVYAMPDKIREEMLESFADGYRKTVCQAWYDGIFLLNYASLAEYSWNLTPGATGGAWNRILQRAFGPAAKPMRTALAHTRFDVRFDIVSRMILRKDVTAPYSFWDMYTLTKIKGLQDDYLAALETDAEKSLAAAQQALPLAPDAEAKAMIQTAITSTERRVALATSARHLLKALALSRSGDQSAALAEMDRCIADGEKLVAAAHTLGLEFPMAVHDQKVLDRYHEIRDEIGGGAK